MLGGAATHQWLIPHTSWKANPIDGILGLILGGLLAFMFLRWVKE